MRFVFLIFMIFPFVVSANVLPLADALRATYTACVGIDDELSELKTMAGINTAITSVGTATGIGATVTGLVKANKDIYSAMIQVCWYVMAFCNDALPDEDEDFASFFSGFISQPKIKR